MKIDRSRVADFLEGLSASAVPECPDRASIAPADDGGLPVGLGEATEPDPRKAAALRAYVKELGGGSLPSELVAEATTEDLEVAQADILRMAAAPWAPGTFAGGDEYQLRKSWEYCPREQRAEKFGVFMLRAVIARRCEAKAAWQQRLAAGFTPEVCVSGAAIEKMPFFGVRRSWFVRRRRRVQCAPQGIITTPPNFFLTVSRIV
jgi:hypothetical protein